MISRPDKGIKDVGLSVAVLLMGSAMRNVCLVSVCCMKVVSVKSDALNA